MAILAANICGLKIESIFAKISKIKNVDGRLELVRTLPNKSKVVNKARKKIIEYYPEEKPIAMQLLGNDAKYLAEASKILEDIGADISTFVKDAVANGLSKGTAQKYVLDAYLRKSFLIRTIRIY